MTTIAQVKVRFDKQGREAKYLKAMLPEKQTKTKPCPECGRLILACFHRCWRCKRKEANP